MARPPSAFVDLHAHSTASDGSRAPADVIREAKRVGLAAIALTDHDTLDGIAEAIAMGAELGVRVVPGVELSAVEGDVETHILGLHLSRHARDGSASSSGCGTCDALAPRASFSD